MSGNSLHLIIGRKEIMKIPEWWECEGKKLRKENMSHIETFVYNNTPAKKEEEEQFREELRLLICCVTCDARTPDGECFRDACLGRECPANAHLSGGEAVRSK